MSGTSVAATLFRLLLYASPASFRDEYGTQMRGDFKDALRDEGRAHGPLAAAAFAFSAYVDIVWTGLREYAAMIFRDFVFAARSLRKTPFFALVVIATLAIAIGANATAFSVLRGVVLAPLPYADASRLVSVTGTLRGKPFALSIPDFLDLRAQNRSFSSMAAYFPGAEGTITGRGNARKISGAVATPGFFEVLGTQPLLGRALSPHDARLGSPQVIVISHELWATFFRSDPRIVGASVLLDGVANRVVGVMPSGFMEPDAAGGFEATDFWTALQPADKMYIRGAHFAAAVGRLRDGVTFGSAHADLDAVFARLVRRYPASDLNFGIDVRSLEDALVGSVRPLLFAIFAAVAGVLLVACANVANLLLSRAATRDRELAIRTAVGASRRRIIVQLLTETFVFAVCGGIAGFALAYVAVRIFVALHPASIPRAADVTLDSVSALYTLGIVAFCTLAAGLAPAFTLSSQGLASALKASGRGGDASRGARTRTALVIAEIALTLTLVVASGLVVRSYLALTHQPLGFTSKGVLVAEDVTLPDNRYKADRAQLALYDRVGREVRAIPGVSDAAWTFAAPFSGRTFMLSFNVVGHPARPGESPDAAIDIVGPQFFGLLGVAVLRGRTFTADDNYNSSRVVVVNAAFCASISATDRR